jgi:hypothetical protein
VGISADLKELDSADRDGAAATVYVIAANGFDTRALRSILPSGEAAMRSRTFGSAAGESAPAIISAAFPASTAQAPESLTMPIILEGEA